MSLFDASGPDERLAATLAILERLIGFDTESSKSNLALVADVEAYLARLGVDYVKVPNAEGDKAALFATIGPKLDGGVVLSGHTDVVPVEGQTWTSDPFTLRRARRSRLWPRHLRHEGLRRDLPRHDPGVSAARSSRGRSIFS